MLDEPTAHLDPESAAAIEAAIARLAEGRTVLLVTHRAELAAALRPRAWSCATGARDGGRDAAAEVAA